MQTRMRIPVLTIVTLVLAIGTASAETSTYRGTGYYVASKELMPLANGGAVIHLEMRTVATIEPSEPGFMFGDCTGMGLLTAKGEFSADLFCNFEENAEDGFDFRGKMTVGGTTGKVIGGSGKWKGATGSGKFRRKFVKGNFVTYEYELKITTTTQ